jgi:hypothetical protein
MKKYYILFLLLIITGTVFAQSITSRDITWLSAKSVELRSSVDLNQNCKLITRSNKQVDYILNETSTLTFVISGIDGTWSDPNTNGSLTYRVKYQGRPGKIIIQRTDSNITATIDFTESAADALKQRILITSFQ